MRNWKTTLAGIVAIIGAIAKMLNAGAVATEDIVAVVTGIGLIAAKDFNVTGKP